MNEPVHLPNRVELRHLRLISAVAAQGSLTAAAPMLGLTQPALSHQLRELETSLRTPLFIRTARRMVPTPAGERLLTVARSVLGEIERFEHDVLSGSYNETRGTLRLATECYTVYHWLPAVLRSFRERWPGVDLHIAPEFTAAPVRALRDGSLDIAIVHRPVPDRRVQLHPLFDDELVAIMSPSHPLARRPHLEPDDFANQHLFLYKTSDGESTFQREFLDTAGVRPATLTRIQLTEAIVSLVAADLGISVLARWALAPALQAGAIAAVRLSAQGYHRRWSLAVRADDPSPPYQFDLIELLRRNLKGGPVARIA